MSAKITLFILFSVWISSCWAGARFFPDRNIELLNQHVDWTPELFLRNLQDESSNSSSPLNSDNSNTSSPISVKLRGDTDLGYYYITLFFGTPLQRQTLIVDTGSSITTFPCEDCVDGCGMNHWNQKFDTRESDTFSEFQCHEEFGNWACNDCTGKCYFGIGYAEGSSYYGHYKKDVVAYGNEVEEYFELLKNQTKNPEKAPDGVSENDQENLDRQARQTELEQVLEKRKMTMPFGCANKETKLFKEQEADGILGLGISTNSRSYPPNLFDVYEMNHPEASRAFSICYAQNSGYLTIGGHNTEYHYPNHPIQKLTYHDEYHQFRVTIEKIQMNGKTIDITSKDLNKGNGAFFDSGTTYTHVPKATYNGIVGSLRDFCQRNGKNCGGTGKVPDKLCWTYDKNLYSNVSEFYKTFPIFDWYFGDSGEAKYEWRPEDYLYTHDSPVRFCMGLSLYDRETILGGTFMKNHDVLFDKNNKQLAFVRSNCRALFGDSGLPDDYNPTDVNTKVIDETDDANKERLIKAGIVLLAGLVLGGLVYLYILIRNRTKYSDMVNEEVQDKQLKHKSDDSSNIGATDESPRAIESKNNFPEYEV